MSEEAVEPQTEQPEVESAQDVAEQVVEDMQQDAAESENQPDREFEREGEKVPLSALQKMRKRAQEAEMRLEWEREQRKTAPEPEEEDMSKYESATKEDLSRVQQEAVRQVEEKIWVKSNQDKYEKINEYLPEFLKQRPNLAYAINSATNRYEEAWTLMEALSPRQQQQLKVAAKTPKREAPGSPGGIPKAASMNQTVDVMSMNDKEFAEWRSSQKRRR